MTRLPYALFGWTCTIAIVQAAVQAAVAGTGAPPTGTPASTSQARATYTVLHEQMDQPSSQAGSSQDFEASDDNYDDQLADDFVVPDGADWKIDEINVIGQYFNGDGPAESFNVYFYADAGGQPGTLLSSRLAQPYTDGANAAITFSEPVALAAGTFWVSVQARMDYVPDGQWLWGSRLAESGNPAMFRNPGGGLSPCVDWSPATTCIGSYLVGDLMFRLLGTALASDAIFCSGLEVGEDGSCVLTSGTGPVVTAD